MKIYVFWGLLILSMSLAAQATITDIQGKVEVLLPGQTQWRAATVNMRLPLEATIATSFNSRATLRLNASTLQLRPMTRISLEELSKQNETENARINLRVGQVRTEVRRADSQEINFTVRSPQATASVRGTQFEMTPWSLTTEEGLVVFQTSTGSSFVPAGTASQIEQFNLPSSALEGLANSADFSDPILSGVPNINWRGGIGSSKLIITLD